ncbi:hypothetical protein [Pseudomonas sp. G2-4]|uniref:hypothetical protein n=1 Tax=Pseudomonas sp. G2-4 TaxID=1506334 RepID=UPI0024B9FB7D|nr:hypothetical protein [Pseudomonas sp. G2-4]WHS62651.1 hypothetical protein QNH97_11645 [Pseudomonas sp. G2-4]
MTQNSSSTSFQLPSRLGVAADLCFSVSDHVGYLADCLLVHDEVVIPLDAAVLNVLEAAFDTNQLRLLLQEKRIRFCPSYSLGYANGLKPETYDRDQFFAKVRAWDLHKSKSDRDGLFSEIEKTFVDPISSNYSTWLPARDAIEDSFGHYAARPGYEFLFPGERYYETGAISGVARMNDLLLAGVPSMEMDMELPQLLELCFPIKRLGSASPGADHFAAKHVINKLHKIENLPTFETGERPDFLRPIEEVKNIVNIVLSDEAHDLRVWLAKNLTANLDVRAAYDSAEKRLPSKKSWTNWIRFGMTTGAGTVAGMFLAGPPGAIVGAAIGAADLASGEKAVAMFDGYHPKIWLSHMQRTGLLKKI